MTREPDTSSHVTYTNRKGQTYFLCDVDQRRGRKRLVFSREPRGKPVRELPAGWDPGESINGHVSLRKIVESPISEAEVQCVRAFLDREPRLAAFQVESRAETIVVHEPQENIGPEVFRILGFDPRAVASFKKRLRYSPVFRFKLIDPRNRTFVAERMCYRSSLEAGFPCTPPVPSIASPGITWGISGRSPSLSSSRAWRERSMKQPRRIWVSIPNPRGPIPRCIREELAYRLQRHAERRRKIRMRKLLLRFRGAYAYLAAVGAQGGERMPIQVCRHIEKGEVPTELCRLGFLGGMDRWEYAFYKYSDEKYERSLCASGSFVATPEEAFDCSAVYLQ